MSVLLQHTPADIVRYALIAAGGGTLPTNESAWPIFAEAEPDLPENCITVFDTTGTSDGRSMTDGEAMLHHGIQIRVRASTGRVGWARMELIRRIAAETIRQTVVNISGTLYLVHCLANISPTITLGEEPTTNAKRSLFTLNAVVALTAL